MKAQLVQAVHNGIYRIVRPECGGCILKNISDETQLMKNGEERLEFSV